MCFVFILIIDIRIDSIPLPIAQQTPKQIPLMVYERPIQGTYAAKFLSICWDFPSLMVVFHSNYYKLGEKTKDAKYSCESITFNIAKRLEVWNHTHTIPGILSLSYFQSRLECFLIIHCTLCFATMEMKWGKEFALIYQRFIHLRKLKTLVFRKLEMDDGKVEERAPVYPSFQPLVSPAFTKAIFHTSALQ